MHSGPDHLPALITPFADPHFIAGLKRHDQRISVLEQGVRQGLSQLDEVLLSDKIGSDRKGLLISYRVIARCAMLVKLKSSDYEQAPIEDAVDRIGNGADEVQRHAGVKAYVQALLDYSHLSLSRDQVEQVWAAIEPAIKTIPPERWLVALAKGWGDPLQWGVYMLRSLMPHSRTLRDAHPSQEHPR